MEKENLEAYALATVGGAIGVYKEILKPNKEAVAISLGVVATGLALRKLL